MSNTDSTCQERHVIVVNDGKRRAIALDAAAYSIGRDPSNAIVINLDTISRQHAMLLRVPIPGTKQYRYRILDGNAQGKPSANGVFIGNQPCQSRDLKNGDTIRFGHTIEASYLTVSMGDAEFVNYLESISYQSIKSDTINAKETLVAAALEEELLTSIATATQPKAQLPRQSSSVTPWTETLHEDNSAVRQPSPYRLWMILIPGLLLLMGLVAGTWMFASTFRSSQSVAEPIPPSASPTQPVKR
jgi:pSer/pThr/pTyr-binding forkhead associated (FHA) protein